MDLLDLINPVVSLLTVLTIIGQIIALLLAGLLLKELLKIGAPSRMTAFIAKHGLLLMFIVALTATAGSLFFSEIALWTPCKDCWLQRIFMYPQVILLGIALRKRDRGIALYILTLSIIGSLISIDHYIDQIQAIINPIEHDPLAPCDATGISCSATEIYEYGYITIPLMALTAFVLNALAVVFMLRNSKHRLS